MTGRRARPFLRALLLVTLLAGCAPVSFPAPARTPDVIYVPTDEDVVKVMLDMAQVTKDDVVYDLGSGDGRIPIAAAKRYGARGVGIELDPGLVAESRAKARRAGVVDRVHFVEGDIFQVDVKDATVVALYLGQDVNVRLRPKLLAELRPGTRIVSHNYDMGDWKPEKSVRVELTYGSARWVHLWIVPSRPTR